MSKSKSSVAELTEQLVVGCSNNAILREIPESKIKEMIQTLVSFQFSEDNRRSAQTNLSKTINEIVDLLSEVNS
jgi:hypothetical protein